MTKAAVIFADGCEEGEALTIVDIFRRAEIQCDMVGLNKMEVTGGHSITMRMDRVLDDSLKTYDMVILPGGYDGAANMRECSLLIDQLQKMDADHKKIAAICAAPIVLDRAGLLKNRKYTCYPSTAEKIKDGEFVGEIIVKDGNLITSQGPATAYAFAYELVKVLGGDALTVQNRMAYQCFQGGQIMTKRAAILMMEGYEESETMQIVDLLRRADVQTDTFCFQDDLFVESMEGMFIKADMHFSNAVRDYDIVIVPGGRTSWQKLIDDPEVMDILKWFNENGKLIGAMCSGTKVLQEAHVLKGKKCTGYTGYADVLKDGDFVEDAAVFDQNIVTSQGPATPYPFAFKIMEALGIDPEPFKEKLLYHFAGGID